MGRRRRVFLGGGLPGPPPARTGYGALLTARQVLALACRADLSIIRWRDGIPLDAGRRYRTETPALRRALEARDQGCRAPGCGVPAAWTTAHHLTPRPLSPARAPPAPVVGITRRTRR